ncbi:MAG: response regulator [Ignavibacteriaceae bacterium]
MRRATYDILIADDNPIYVKTLGLLIKTILGDRLTKLDVACNGKIAVDKALNIRYDIIFMDISMPEMDGISATRLINKERYRDTLIIAVTYDKTFHSLNLMLQSGARKIIYKDDLTMESLAEVFDSRKDIIDSQDYF